MLTEWTKVGVIGVDADVCWVGDPCYIIGEDSSHGWKTWGDFCDSYDFNKLVHSFNYKLGHEGLGVVVSTGWGDGTYPVYVKYGEEGRVAEVKVVFMDSEEEADD